MLRALEGQEVMERRWPQQLRHAALLAGVCTCFVLAAMMGRTNSSSIEDMSKSTVRRTVLSGPLWRMPMSRRRPTGLATRRPIAPRQGAIVGRLQRMLAEHPTFVKEWQALSKLSGSNRELVKALSSASHQPYRMQRQRTKMQQLVFAKRQALSNMNFFGIHIGVDNKGFVPPPKTAPRPQPFKDDAEGLGWVLTNRTWPNITNNSFGFWRTPENSNQYSGMTEPVRSTNRVRDE